MLKQQAIEAEGAGAGGDEDGEEHDISDLTQ
jgi:hypothetical protein